MHNNRHGLTLIELLVVVILLGILASVAISSFGHTAERAYDSTALSDLRSVTSAIERFYIQHERYPEHLEELEFTPSSGVHVTQFSLGTQAGTESVHIHVEHEGSDHYFHARFPTEPGFERREN